MSISKILKNIGMYIIIVSIIIGIILFVLTLTKYTLFSFEIFQILIVTFISGIVIALIGTLIERYEEWKQGE